MCDMFIPRYGLSNMLQVGKAWDWTMSLPNVRWCQQQFWSYMHLSLQQVSLRRDMSKKRHWPLSLVKKSALLNRHFLVLDRREIWKCSLLFLRRGQLAKICHQDSLDTRLCNCFVTFDSMSNKVRQVGKIHNLGATLDFCWGGLW